MENDLKKVIQKAIDLNVERMSPTRARKFSENPARALYDLTGDYPWWTGDNKALDYGTIVHTYAENGTLDDLPEKTLERVKSKRGGLLSWTNEAVKVGQSLSEYFDNIKGEKIYEQELTISNDDGSRFHGFADVINDDDGDVSVYDIKTLQSMEFDKWIQREWAPDSLEQYIKQIAFYALVLGTEKATLVFIKKSDKTPFIHEYTLSQGELKQAQLDVLDEMKSALEIARGHGNPAAINDGSEWAYHYFGGKI